MINPSNVKCLVLEGGGIKGMAYVGFIRTIQQEIPTFIEQIEQIAGSSIGAFIGALLVIGKSTDDIEDIMRNIASKDIANFGCCGCMPKLCMMLCALQNMVKGYGLVRRDVLENEIRRLFKDENEEDIIFSGLKKRLVVTAINLNAHKIVFFSNELTPNVPVYKAVMSSMCAPFVFQPLLYDFNPDYSSKNHLLIDGGNMMNFPIKTFDAPNPYDAVNSSFKNKNVIGIRLDTPEDLKFLDGQVNERIDTLVDFLYEYTDTMSYNCKLNIRDDERTISILTKSYKMENYSNYEHTYEELLNDGNNAANAYLNRDR
jgi:predicted acylesterase/phospholipase RssA